MMRVREESRGDSDAMYHQYGVALQNVFDTQIAYAVIKRQMSQGYAHAIRHTAL
jgi:ribonuclease D